MSPWENVRRFAIVLTYASHIGNLYATTIVVEMNASNCRGIKVCMKNVRFRKKQMMANEARMVTNICNIPVDFCGVKIPHDAINVTRWIHPNIGEITW